MRTLLSNERRMVASLFIFAIVVIAFGFFDTFYGISGGNRENLISAGVMPSLAISDFGPSVLLGVIVGYAGLILGYLLLARPKKGDEAAKGSATFKSKSFFYWFTISIVIHSLSYIFLSWVGGLGEGAAIFIIPPLFILPMSAQLFIYCALPIGAISMSIALTRYVQKNREIKKSDLVLLYGGAAILILLALISLSSIAFA
jgi:hypothetical protein